MRFAKFISAPIRKLKVDESVISCFEDELKTALSMRGLAGITTDTLAARLVQEAYFRAGAHESDGVPRHGQMEDEIERIAKAVDVLFSGKEPGDAAIDAILVHHGAKKVSSSST
jgi:hypothetical protein